MNTRRSNRASRPVFLRTCRYGLALLAGFGLAGCGAASDAELDSDAETTAADAQELIVTCNPPYTRVCVPPPPNSGVKLGFCFCQPPPRPPAQHFDLIPDYYVTHVVYAPPGRSSSITYSSSGSVGCSSSVSNGVKNDVSVKAEASGSFFGSADVSVSAGLEQETSRTDDLEVTVERSHEYTAHGQTDHIDHNYDEIWILIRPRLNMTFQPKGSVPSQTANMTWKFGAQDGVTNGIPMKIYAGWLNGALPMDSGVKLTLDFYGITPDKYAKLLAADPLFTGTTPNMTMDPGRFESVGVFPYVPPLNPDDDPSEEAHTVKRSETTTSSVASSTDISVGYSVEAGFDVGAFKASLEVSSTWTWTHSANLSNSIGTEISDSFTVGQPAFGYTGPNMLRVYKDKIFGTYAFTLDWPQGESNLALGRPSWQSSDLPGYGAVAARANDGNTSGNFWDSSVTHTDWGFVPWGGAGWPGQHWYVDLGSERVVTSVKIFNRTDCCTERLSRYNILAWDSAQYVWKVISDHSNEDTSGVSFLHLHVRPVRTQYVMVAKTDENYLHLAEVQVMGF